MESWVNELIKNNNMTRKEWQNVKAIIGGIWDYAFRKGYISKNQLIKLEKRLPVN